MKNSAPRYPRRTRWAAEADDDPRRPIVTELDRPGDLDSRYPEGVYVVRDTDGKFIMATKNRPQKTAVVAQIGEEIEVEVSTEQWVQIRR